MAELNPEVLFTEIRSAHRMVVAYYKRLFPIIRDVTSTLELSFYVWRPSEFDRPGQLGTNVMERWEWDMIPGACANYVFYSAANSNAQQPGEWLVDFHVITDTGVVDVSHKTIKGGRSGNQDPLELLIPVEKAQSLLRVYVYLATKEGTLNWYHGIWNGNYYPNIVSSPDRQVLDSENGIYASGFEMPLAELTTEGAKDKLVEKIIAYKSALDKGV